MGTHMKDFLNHSPLHSRSVFAGIGVVPAREILALSEEPKSSEDRIITSSLVLKTSLEKEKCSKNTGPDPDTYARASRCKWEPYCTCPWFPWLFGDKHGKCPRYTGLAALCIPQLERKKHWKRRGKPTKKTRELQTTTQKPCKQYCEVHKDYPMNLPKDIRRKSKGSKI